MKADMLGRVRARVGSAQERARRCDFRGYAPGPDPEVVSLTYRNGTSGDTAGSQLRVMIRGDVPALAAYAMAGADLAESIADANEPVGMVVREALAQYLDAIQGTGP